GFAMFLNYLSLHSTKNARITGLYNPCFLILSVPTRIRDALNHAHCQDFEQAFFLFQSWTPTCELFGRKAAAASWAWSVAYWLKRGRSRPPRCCQLGAYWQQFSLPENIQLSLASADFLKNINVMAIFKRSCDLQFNHSGYLSLQVKNAAHIMEANHKTQMCVGAKVILLSPAQIKERFPWMNTDGVVLASYGRHLFFCTAV
uniref:Uncharacterized protein n=1 Tax=Denticeps clupeoides TaxID=299321 RepID=A0AAY4AN97_9TELE